MCKFKQCKHSQTDSWKAVFCYLNKKMNAVGKRKEKGKRDRTDSWKAIFYYLNKKMNVVWKINGSIILTRKWMQYER